MSKQYIRELILENEFRIARTICASVHLHSANLYGILFNDLLDVGVGDSEKTFEKILKVSIQVVSDFLFGVFLSDYQKGEGGYIRFLLAKYRMTPTYDDFVLNEQLINYDEFNEKKITNRRRIGEILRLYESRILGFQLIYCIKILRGSVEGGVMLRYLSKLTEDEYSEKYVEEINDLSEISKAIVFEFFNLDADIVRDHFWDVGITSRIFYQLFYQLSPSILRLIKL